MSRSLPTAAWPALGSTAVLRAAHRVELAAAVEAVERELGRFDAACSRFRGDSELSRLNSRAGEEVPVGPLLLEALATALRGAELTVGALDPTIGRCLEGAGYDRDWELIRELPDPVGGRGSETPVLRARRRGRWREIELDGARGTARIPRDVSIDLGATAKALAADRACEAARRALGCGALVALGGDIAACGEPPAGGWAIHVTDDHRDGAAAPGQRVWIDAGGLATSSTLARSWMRAGRRMHHIIDPATGRPAETCWRTVSVAAADCTDANIASTGALLRGSGAPAWIAELGLPARLVDHAGNVTTLAGWPAGEDGGGRAARPVAVCVGVTA